MAKFKLESFPSLKKYLGDNYLVDGDSRKRDLYRICSELGIIIFATKFNDDSLSGLIRKTDEQWEIYVNDTDSPRRKNFTIAHELGHYFSHLDKQLSYRVLSDAGILEDKAIFSRDVTNGKKHGSEEVAQMEAEANFIASNLLMPANLVEAAFLENKNIDEMADEFGVSGSAIGFRLVNLSLIPIESVGTIVSKPALGNDEFGETRKLVPSELNGYTSGHNQSDDLGRVLGVLFAPTLSLVKYYLHSKNGNKKTIANLLQEFSETHEAAFLTSFIIDWVFRFVGILLVIVVFGRGIGLFNF